MQVLGLNHLAEKMHIALEVDTDGMVPLHAFTKLVLAEQDEKNTIYSGLSLIDNCRRDVLKMRSAFQLVDENGTGTNPSSSVQSFAHLVQASIQAPIQSFWIEYFG